MLKVSLLLVALLEKKGSDGAHLFLILRGEEEAEEGVKLEMNSPVRDFKGRLSRHSEYM